MYTSPTTRIVKSLGMTVALLCLTVLLQMPTRADTLTIIGSSNSQNPLLGSSGQIGFLGQAFNNNFNVTAVGQTFDFVFGQYQIGPGMGAGDSGCTDGPCVPITLTGSLTTPIGALSFSGFFEESEGPVRSLTVDWLTGSGPFNFSTPEGGVVIFTMELPDFLGNNPGATPLLINQLARVTITAFQPGGQTPVPEPATMLLLGTGLAGLYAARRRRQRS
jgi:PEP-CTERM motif